MLDSFKTKKVQKFASFAQKPSGRPKKVKKSARSALQVTVVKLKMLVLLFVARTRSLRITPLSVIPASIVLS